MALLHCMQDLASKQFTCCFTLLLLYVYCMECTVVKVTTHYQKYLFLFFTNPFGFTILSNCVLLLPNFYPSRGCQFYSCVIFMCCAQVSRATNFLTLPYIFQIVRISRAHYLRASNIPDITHNQYCTEIYFVSILHRNLINLLIYFDRCNSN